MTAIIYFGKIGEGEISMEKIEAERIELGKIDEKKVKLLAMLLPIVQKLDEEIYNDLRKLLPKDLYLTSRYDFMDPYSPLSANVLLIHDVEGEAFRRDEASADIMVKIDGSVILRRARRIKK